MYCMYTTIYYLVCKAACVCVSLIPIKAQMAGPIMIKFGTRMWIDLGIIPS